MVEIALASALTGDVPHKQRDVSSVARDMK